MYSKKQMGYPSGGYSITPPPGYDGSRFKSRSDGRDDAFPPYDKPARTYTAEKKPSDNNSNIRSSTYDDDDVFSFDTPKAEKSNSIFPILKNGISNEELLIIALLIVLISENNISSELVLMLGLLLCL